MFTDTQLAEIRERVDAATSGPWLTIQPGGPNGPFWAICNPKGNVIALRLSLSSKDAEFIAHARADVAALLDEVERLRVELQATRTKVSDQPRCGYCLSRPAQRGSSWCAQCDAELTARDNDA